MDTLFVCAKKKARAENYLLDSDMARSIISELG